MRAEIIATGTELLLGHTVDTNTSFLAGQLAVLGIDLYYASLVGDNYDRMLGVLKQAWERSDLIMTTGGLGPTGGDITRDVIAGLVGEKPSIDAELKLKITRFFTSRGLEISPNNLKQAMLVPSATAMPNPHGTAPGWWVEKEGRTIIALPGPPREMEPMWRSFVFPRLQQKSGAIIRSRMLKTAGLSEARVDELLRSFTSFPNPTLAMYAKTDGIHLRVTAKAPTRERAGELITRLESDIRAALGDYIWGADEDTLEGIVSGLLKEKGLSLAVAESFTGGSLTQALASAPECQGHFKGGTVRCAAGDLTEQSAVEIARGARVQFAASIGVGLAGRTEESGGVRTGKVLAAFSFDNAAEAVVRTYSGIYPQIIKRAAYLALFDLRKLLLSR